MLFDKPIKEITKADLQALVTDGVREDKHLEFKDELPTHSKMGEEKKADLHGDIAAFANAGGGLLLYGVTEQRVEGKTTAVAKAVPGLKYNYDELRRAVQSSADGGIDDRVNGLEFHQVEGFKKGAIFLLRVPRSWRGPHRVVHTRQFPMRFDGGNRMLDTSEIRAAILGSAAMADRIRAFRDDRIRKIMATDMPVSLGGGGMVVLHIVPFAALEPGRQLSSAALRDAEPRLVPLNATGGFNGSRYNLDGVIASNPSINPSSYVQLFRSGAIEAVDAHSLEPYGTNDKRFDGRSIIPTGYIESTLLDAAKRNLDVLRLAGFEPPISVMVSLVNAKGYILEAQIDEAGLGRVETPVDRNPALLPDVLLQSYDERPDVLLRPVFDALWQAGGWPASPNYDADGKWTWPARRR